MGNKNHLVNTSAVIKIFKNNLNSRIYLAQLAQKVTLLKLPTIANKLT